MAYQPTDWEHGDIITGGKLNKIEQELTHVADNATYGFGGAQLSSDGLTPLSYINAGDPMPSNPQKGDTVFLKDGNDFLIYSYNGEDWVLKVDPDLSNRIEETIKTASDNTDKAIADNNTQINETINQVAKEQADLALKDGDFNNKAQAMADKALSDAKDNTATVAKSTLDTANQNIADAKKSVSDDLSKEATDRASAVSALDTKAQGYADTAKKNAIDVATSADGVINKKIDDTASSITSTVSQNKKDAEGKITTAQSTATQALNGLSSKVDTATYNAKTGQLSTDVTNVTQTANQAKTDIASIKQTDTTQDARMTTIEADASGTKTTVSAIQTKQGQQSGDISTLQQRANGFDATVAKVNGLSVGARNYWALSGRTLGSYIEIDGSIQVSGTGLTAYNQSYFDVLPKQTVIVTLFDTDSNAPTALAGRLACYDKDKNFLSVSGNIPITKGSYKYVVPDNVAYFRMSLFKYDDIRTKVEIGTIATDWTPAPEDVDRATAKAQLTADQATTSLNNYKTDADGRITKAQSDITQTAKDVTTKVSQTDYNAKTGDLDTRVTKAQTTADGVATTVGAYKTSNDNRVKATETSIAQNTKDITLRATTADLDSAKKDYNAQIAQVNVNAQGITSQVSNVNSKIDNLAVGGRNYFITSTATKGYLADNGVIGSATNHDLTSDFISVSPNDTWIATGRYNSNASSSPEMVIVFQYYDTNKAVVGARSRNSSGKYVTQYSATKTIPSGVAYMRVSSGWVNDGYGSFKIEKGNTVTDWSPAPEDVDNKISAQQITINGITDTVSKQGTNIDSVTERVTTAEGTLSTATNNISGLQTSVTQTANQLKQEVTDRTTGDSNTLQSSKDFTTSSVSNAVTGMNSTVTQTANGILAQVEATNMVVNSEFDPLNGTWYALSNGGSVGSTAGIAWNAPKTGGFADWPAVNGSRIVSYAVATWYTSALVTASAGKVFSASIVAGRSPAPTVSTALDYRIGFWDSNRKLLATSSAGNIIDGTVYKGIQKYVVENKTAPANTAFVSVIIAHSSASATDYITRPSLNMGAKASPYTPTYGTSSNSTVLSLFKDNWSIGIADNISNITSGIVGNASQMSLISKNVTIDSPNTQIKGTAWIQSAMIANGAIGSAQIGDATITSAKIAQLDVAKLTGNTTSFIKSNWDSAYGNVTIDPDKISLESYSGSNLVTQLDIGNLGIVIKMPGVASFLDSTVINAAGMSFQHSGGSYATVGVMDAGFTLEHNQLGGSPMSIRIGDGGTPNGGTNSANDMAFAISAAQDNGTAPQLIWAGSRVGKVSSQYRTWDNPQGFILADSIKFSTWDNTPSKVEIDDTVNFYNYAPKQVYGQRFSDGTERTLHLGGKDFSTSAKWFGFLDGGDQAGFGTDNTGDVIFFMKGKTYSLYTMLGKLGMR
ncbi:hypothetical protein [Leuconostoc mesenteroides]|uniref:hypothetical protein n=1 Tax=Leuconostoc mesenteroides TaxID=1245 RepID=UPI0030CBF024